MTDVVATLFLMVLTGTTGTYQADYKEFPNVAACERVRERLIATAMQQENMWLISQCGIGDEPVRLGIFFNGESPVLKRSPILPKSST